MIDFHSHTVLSDGDFIPSELARRAEVLGYRAIALTDHGDASNLDIVIPALVKVSKSLARQFKVRVIPGVELTHVPPALISGLEKEARGLGAKIVIVHGETIVEPVPEGTNMAALEANIDILAHPGLITEEEVGLAKNNDICLEITARKGHSLTNGHVAAIARRVGAKLIVNSDTHSCGDLLTREFARKVALGAGLSEEEFNECRSNSEELLARVG